MSGNNLNINTHQNLSTITECITQTDLKERFISSTGLEKTELIWNFLSMVEFSGATVDGITPLDFSSNFAIGMLEAFEEFDKLSLDGYPNGGLITKQFEAIAQKCADKGVKLLIGENIQCNDIIGLDSNNLYQDHIFINFSENMVKKQMENDIYIMQKSEFGEGYEIKAMPLKDFVAPEEKNENKLLAKCAAYLLFHELFHVNSFLDCQCDVDIYDSFNNNYENLNLQPDEIFCLKKIFDNQAYIDDAINTLNIAVNNQNRIPGEFELLTSIQSDKQIMRIYTGQENWNSDVEKMTYCSKIFNRSFNCPQDNKIQDLLIKINEVLDFKSKLINIRFPLKTTGAELVMFDSIYASVSQIEQKMDTIEVQRVYKFVSLLSTIKDQYTKPVLLDLRDLEYTYKGLRTIINDLKFSKSLQSQIYTFLNQENCFVLEQKIEILQQEFNLLQKSETTVSREDESIIKRITQLLNVANQYIYYEIKVLPHV